MADSRTYFRVADDIDENPKMLNLSDAAFRLDLHGIAYCARNLTDGRIPRAMAPRLISGYSKKVLEELLTVGRWIDQKSHYEIHDFLEHQRSKEQVLAIRRVRQEAGSRGGKARAKAEQKRSKNQPEADTETELSNSSPPPELDSETVAGGGADASLSKIKTSVINALTLRQYTDDEIAPGLEMLETRALAGELGAITSPSAYVRHFADKAREAADKGEPNRMLIDGELMIYVEGENWVEAEGRPEIEEWADRIHESEALQ